MARKKGIKNIVNNMNANVQQGKRAKDIARSNREKAKRRLQRTLDAEGQVTPSKEAALSTAQSLKSEGRLSSASSAWLQVYEKNVYDREKKAYPSDVQQMSENIPALTKSIFGSEKLTGSGLSEQTRKNLFFANQINQSTKQGGLSLLNGDETKAFYAGTMDMWKGAANSRDYNNKIMEETGISDLETIYKLFTEKELNYEDFGFDDEEVFNTWLKDLDKRFGLFERRKIIQDELNRQFGDLDSTDDDEFNLGDEETERTGSPDYINNIITRLAKALQE